MSDKQKKFEPNAGFMITVLRNVMAVREVAHALNGMFPETLAEALEKAGYQLTPDPFNISSDTTKVIILQAKQEMQGLHIVKKESNDTGSDTSTD